MSLELPVHTDRLVLRRPQASDVDDIYAYQRLPEVAKYLYRLPRTRDEVAERARRDGDASFTKTSDDLLLVVERHDKLGVIGEVVLKLPNEAARQAEVGYIFNPQYAGHGYATEAAREMLCLGFETFGLHRVFARLDEENTASANICRRLGMRQEARLVDADMRDGVWGTELVFAMLDREWEQHSD